MRIHTLLLAALPLASTALAAAPWDSVAYPTAADYTRIIGRFPRYAERGWHGNYQDNPALGYFGDGRSDENGQRTLANFCLVYAWLATNPAYDSTESGVSRETLRAHALAAIRYRLRTHVTGDLPCTDDRPWGNHWQSAWWVSRMVPAVLLLRAEFSASEMAAFDRMVHHEADRHVGLAPRYGEYGDSKAEENAWDAEVVAWALSLYPNHPNVPGWKAALNTLCLNTFSIESDRDATELLDGKPLNEWIGGPSIHPDFTIENHGPFHICYQICPQHSLSWVWYAFASQQQTAPPAAERHGQEVWDRLLQFALWNGRFAYVGGKDWPRYAYGLYFILPTLVHRQIAYGDADARLLERQRVGAFEREQLVWDDGSFFSGRFTDGIMERWPSEWETDCAGNLTIAAMMHEMNPRPVHPTSSEVLAARNVGTFISPYCEIAMRRDPRRFVGWSWRSYGGPVTGMVSSESGEDMLEWNRSLSGTVAFGPGVQAQTRVDGHDETVFDGGFGTIGEVWHGRPQQGPSDWRLEVADTNIPTATIAEPNHPLFTTPNAVTSVAFLQDLDSVTAAGANWTPLAVNRDGGPAIFEAKPGRGHIIVNMTNVEELAARGDAPAVALFENLVTYAGAAGRRCGYFAGEAHLRNALDAAGVEYTVLSGERTTRASSFAQMLEDLDVLFIDRSAKTAIPLYSAILAWAEAGGTVVHSIIQDEGWNPEAWAASGRPVLRQQLACVALPDGRSTLVVSRWLADHAAQITSLDLLTWRVANDVFNDRQRIVTSDDPAQEPLKLLGLGLDERRVLSPVGRTLVIDGDLGLTTFEPGTWQIVDTPRRDIRSICAAVVQLMPREAPFDVAAGDEVARSAVLLRTNVNEDARPTDGAVRWTGDTAVASLTMPDGTAQEVTLDFAANSVTVR